MRSILHWLAHRLGLNQGRVVSALDDHGRVWIGFRCTACGKLSDPHPSLLDQPLDRDFK